MNAKSGGNTEEAAHRCSLKVQKNISDGGLIDFSF